jgi:mono/diheme cytochrome c family protein
MWRSLREIPDGQHPGPPLESGTVSRRRLLVLATLVMCGALAVALPVWASTASGPISEANGVGDGPLKDLPGNAANGKKLFVVFCGKCHAMQAAGTKGTIGPNLDRDRVSYTNVVNAVVQGVGGIQAEYLLRVMKFAQLYDVAKFVTTRRR